MYYILLILSVRIVLLWFNVDIFPSEISNAMSYHALGALMLAAVIYIPIYYYSTFRLLNKAGMPGWYTFIPFYGLWKFYDVSVGHGAFMWGNITITLLMVLYQIQTRIPLFQNYEVYKVVDKENGNNNPAFICYLIVIGLVIHLYSMFKLGRKFDKSTGFCWGLALCPFVFLPILAHDKSVYCRYY